MISMVLCFMMELLLFTLPDVDGMCWEVIQTIFFVRQEPLFFHCPILLVRVNFEEKLFVDLKKASENMASCRNSEGQFTRCGPMSMRSHGVTFEPGERVYLIAPGRAHWKPGYAIVVGSSDRGGMVLMDVDREVRSPQGWMMGGESRPGERVYLVGKSLHGGALWYTARALRKVRRR
jgi:hypothetical protein